MRDPERRWWRIAPGSVGILVLLLVAVFWAIGGFDLFASMRGPATPFAQTQAPPAPDYTKPGAWLAFPGRNGLERSTPPGMTPIDEKAAPVDVFFVHPTTYKGSAVWNAPFDASDDKAPLNPPVLLDQVSVFNGCCRMYAPRYRQATLAALKKPRAMALAFDDVVAAFRYYIAHLNHGRPFIIASHSQGTVPCDPPVAAGNPRHAAPGAAGRGISDRRLHPRHVSANSASRSASSATRTGCVVSYNTSQAGRSGARMIVDGKNYWWRGRFVTNGKPKSICVNPLTWNQQGAAPASGNAGSLPFPAPPFGTTAKPLPALVRNLTGAECRDSLLEVDVPWSAPAGFIDRLSLIFGSYHLNDYGFFYEALRRNAIDRAGAWTAAHRAVAAKR